MKMDWILTRMVLQGIKSGQQGSQGLTIMLLLSISMDKGWVASWSKSTKEAMDDISFSYTTVSSYWIYYTLTAWFIIDNISTLTQWDAYGSMTEKIWDLGLTGKWSMVQCVNQGSNACDEIRLGDRDTRRVWMLTQGCHSLYIKYEYNSRGLFSR